MAQGILPSHDRYLPLMYEEPSSILDYMTDDDLLLLWDYRETLNGIDAAEFRITEDLRSMTEDGYFILDKDYFVHKAYIIDKIKKPIVLGSIPVSINEFRPDMLIEFKIRQTEFLSLALFEEEAASLIKEGYEICAVAPDRDAEERLRSDLRGLQIQTAVGNLPGGYILPDVKKSVFEFRQRSVSKKRRRSKFSPSFLH